MPKREVLLSTTHPLWQLDKITVTRNTFTFVSEVKCLAICVYKYSTLQANEHFTKFRCGFPEVELGILPAWCGTQRLPRLTSLQLALDIIPTGRRMRIQETVKNGIVDKVSERVSKIILLSLEFASHRLNPFK